MNIIKHFESSSIVVQWDVLDDFLHTTYTVIWTDDRNPHGEDNVDEQTSYTITGLTLDTVYTITVTAANTCGSGPEFRANVTFSIGMYVPHPLCMYIIIQYVALVLLSASINPTYVYCIHHP